MKRIANAHSLEFTSIAGQSLPLAKFAGRAALIVNTASYCGFTPQCAELQQLWYRYRDRGLLMLGIPSNDFGQQEPDDEAAIRAFCNARYQIDFPMTCRQKVIGEYAHPFYRWVVQELGEAAAPRWNFHKYLVDPSGDLAGLWPSVVRPRAFSRAHPSATSPFVVNILW